MSCRLAALALLLPTFAACNVSPTAPGTTGGVGDTGSDAGASCDRGTVVLLTDYMSTQIALSTMEGATQSAAFLSTASTMTSGLAFALSGDVVLPRTTPASGRVVLLDRYGTNVVTWADPSSAKVLAQLPVGTGFESNPQDYLEFDATHAYLTRAGVNAAPGKQPFDEGSDVLVLDTARPPSITKSIAMPTSEGLPPNPASMVAVGSTVIVVLSPISTDFATVGHGVLVGLENEAIAWKQTVTGLKTCDHPTLSPSGRTMALACEGQLDAMGNVMDTAESAVALFDVTTLPPKLVKAFPIADQLGATVQSGVSWVSEDVLLGKTQTALGGSASNEAFALDVTTGKATALLTAGKDAMGKGKGLVYGDVLCHPGCGNVCLMADADVGRLRRWSISGGALKAMSDVSVDPATGLPPVALGGY